MHKNRLQELCHKQMWPFPAYSSCRDGPDHNPRFRASVVVNGHSFDAPDLSKSVKDAQNKAAEVALDHLSTIASSAASSQLSDDVPSIPRSDNDMQIPYKSQLQIYVQKRNIGAPKYDSVRAGSAHALRFKAMVTVEGQTFESSEYYSTLREAEHSAARVALMSLPPEENQRILQDEPNFYKNFLLQLVQKEGLSLPLYNTSFNGVAHMPSFTCTVVVDGESFVGAAGRTKKQAEMNAAKVAWDHLKERSHSLKSQGKSVSSLNSLRNHATDINLMDQPNRPFEISTQNIKEDFETTGVSEKSQHVGEVAAKKIYQRVLGCKGAAVNKHDEEMVSSVYNNLLKPSHLKLDSCGSAVKDLTMHMDGTNPHDGSHQNANKAGDETFSSCHADRTDFSLSKPDFDAAIKKEHKTQNERNAEDFDSTSGCTDSLDLFRLKLDSSRGANRNINLNVLPDENFCDHIDPQNYTVPKQEFDARIRQDESKVITPFKDFNGDDVKIVDSPTLQDESKDISDDAFKIVDSPTLLCNRVRVYRRKPDMVLPAGSTLLPLSDDTWVAVSLDFADHDNSLPTIS